MKFIEVKGSHSDGTVKLSYCDYGVGKPVVLIHGWPMSKEMWEYQLEPLVDAGLRVIKYDRRGFGKSDKPWNGYDYDTLAGDLNELLKQLSLEDVTLVGFSMGGGEVARYFSKYGGERVSQVVLVSSILPFMLKTNDNETGIAKDIFDEMLTQVTNDRIGFLDGFGKSFFGINLLSHPLSAPLLEYYRMLCSLASARATRECMKSFAFTDFRKDVKKINVPTLIIHGNNDKTVPIEISSDESSRLIPDNKYVVYDGAPHGLFYTHKERLNDDLISFITTGAVKEYDQENILFPFNEGLGPSIYSTRPLM
jgi:non-heme chloroperoxidase